jgi:hypothetical protein
MPQQLVVLEEQELRLVLDLLVELLVVEMVEMGVVLMPQPMLVVVEQVDILEMVVLV